MAFVFLTGATGFMGRQLAAELLRRGHTVRGLVRPGSESRLAAGCEGVTGDPLDAGSYGHRVAPADTFVQLVGVSHPSPAKAAQFRSVDLVSAKAGAAAAAAAGVRHFIYVSVAHPAPIMREYIAARSEAEEAIRAQGLNATILRPWYVLGPGRRWPLVLLPMYWLMGALPATRESARRLGLGTLPQMVANMAHAVEDPAAGVRVVEVPGIRLNRLCGLAGTHHPRIGAARVEEPFGGPAPHPRGTTTPCRMILPPWPRRAWFRKTPYLARTRTASAIRGCRVPNRPVPSAGAKTAMEDEQGNHGPRTVTSGPVNYNRTCQK